VRKYQYMFTIECGGDGRANVGMVENMIDLTMQELIHDDSFIEALDEKISVTIQVLPV
jgi:hypothetical protein